MLHILEQSPEIAPLLQRLYDRQSLYQLARKDDDMARAELSKVMADLLQLPLSPVQSELLTDVLIKLTRQAESDLRQALAERLSLMDNIPLRMVLHLANDEIEVARPILKKSPVLEDMDLIYIIKSQAAEYWQEIAQRQVLSDKVIDVLAETGDVGTAINLAENRAITLTEFAMDMFTPMAAEHEDLARPLLARDELPRELAAKLYESVGAELKKSLNNRFADMGANVAPVLKVLDDITAEFKKTALHDFMPSESVIAAARNMKERGALTQAVMQEVLKRGQINSFIAQFAAFTGIAPRVVYEMLTQKNGRSLAVACKATDVDKSVFVGFFLMTHKIRNGYQPVINNQDLATAIRTYDAIKKEDAQRLLGQ